MSNLLFELVAIVGATVHGMDENRAPIVATVLIDGASIKAVGADVAIPAGTRRIDGSGMHLVPGLIDSFAYHDAAHDLLYVAAGVTTIVDHGNELSRIYDQRLEKARDRVPGPSIVTAGAVLDGVPPASPAALLVKSAKDVESVAKGLVDQDPGERADFLAFQSSLSLDAWRKLIEYGHAQKLAVWGPTPKGATLLDCARASQDGVLFLDGFMTVGADWSSLDLAKLEPAIAELKKAHVAIIPLVRGLSRLTESSKAQFDDLEDLDPQFRAQWAAEWKLREPLATPAYVDNAKKALAKQRALVKKLFDAGVELAPGSGSPHPWLKPGSGLIRELVEWETAGIPAKECLAAATWRAAKRWGLADRVGKIAVGQRADLALVGSDPELSIANLSDVRGVMVRGRWLAKDELAAKRTELRAAQKSALELAAKPLAVDEPALPKGKLLLAGYSESATEGSRTAGERWAIVEEESGATDFVAKRLIPASEGHLAVHLDLRQRVVENQLESFEITLDNGGHQLVVHGVWTAEQMRVQRQLDGHTISNQGATERIACVDIGSVTSFMLLHRFHAARKEIPVVRFYAGLELEVVHWTQSLDKEGRTAFRTPSGGKLAEFTAVGALSELYEQEGSGQTDTMTRSVDGPGFAALAAKPVDAGTKK